MRFVWSFDPDFVMLIPRNFHRFFLAVASILSTYNIEHAMDINGDPIPVNPDYTKGCRPVSIR